jgi:hypothetical protein
MTCPRPDTSSATSRYGEWLAGPAFLTNGAALAAEPASHPKELKRILASDETTKDGSRQPHHIIGNLVEDPELRFPTMASPWPACGWP